MSSERAGNPPTPPDPVAARRFAERVAARSRDQTLTEWRRVDLRPAEKAQRRGDRPIADVLPNVLGRIRIDQRQAESQIIEVWKRTIDPTIVAHAHPVSLAKGTLFVAVDTSAWLSEIVRYRSREILERMQLAAGKDVVRKISFRIG